MIERISRRRWLQGLGATLALGATPLGATLARAQAETPPAEAPAVASAEPSAQTTELPEPNVWAAIRSGLHPAVTGFTPLVYVPNELSGDVVVIDPAAMRIVDRFSVGALPQHITPSYDLGRLYVNVMGSSRLVVIDPWAGRPAASIPVAVPYNLYFSPDGTKAIVAAESVNRLDFYNSSTWEPLARLPIPGSGVDHLDFSADGSYLLVGCEYGGQVVKVDVNQMAVAGWMSVGGWPIDVKLAPAGDVFYIANQRRHGVSIVDPVAMREVGFLPTGLGAHGMAISRDTRALYVSNRLNGTISVIDFAAAGIATTWYIGGSPDMLQVSADGTQLWASGRFHGEVYVVDTRGGQLINRFRTGAAPHGLTFFPQPGRFSLGHNGVYR